MEEQRETGGGADSQENRGGRGGGKALIPHDSDGCCNRSSRPVRCQVHNRGAAVEAGWLSVCGSGSVPESVLLQRTQTYQGQNRFILRVLQPVQLVLLPLLPPCALLHRQVVLTIMLILLLLEAGSYLCVYSVYREPPWLSASGDSETEPQHNREDGQTEQSDAAERSAAFPQQHPVRHAHTHILFTFKSYSQYH